MPRIGSIAIATVIGLWVWAGSLSFAEVKEHDKGRPESSDILECDTRLKLDPLGTDPVLSRFRAVWKSDEDKTKGSPERKLTHPEWVRALESLAGLTPDAFLKLSRFERRLLEAFLSDVPAPIANSQNSGRHLALAQQALKLTDPSAMDPLVDSAIECQKERRPLAEYHRELTKDSKGREKLFAEKGMPKTCTETTQRILNNNGWTRTPFRTWDSRAVADYVEFLARGLRALNQRRLPAPALGSSAYFVSDGFGARTIVHRLEALFEKALECPVTSPLRIMLAAELRGLKSPVALARIREHFGPDAPELLRAIHHLEGLTALPYFSRQLPKIQARPPGNPEPAKLAFGYKERGLDMTEPCNEDFAEWVKSLADVLTGKQGLLPASLVPDLSLDAKSALVKAILTFEIQMCNENSVLATSVLRMKDLLDNQAGRLEAYLGKREADDLKEFYTNTLQRSRISNPKRLALRTGNAPFFRLARDLERERELRRRKDLEAVGAAGAVAPKDDGEKEKKALAAWSKQPNFQGMVLPAIGVPTADWKQSQIEQYIRGFAHSRSANSLGPPPLPASFADREKLRAQLLNWRKQIESGAEGAELSPPFAGDGDGAPRLRRLRALAALDQVIESLDGVSGDSHGGPHGVPYGRFASHASEETSKWGDETKQQVDQIARLVHEKHRKTLTAGHRHALGKLAPYERDWIVHRLEKGRNDKQANGPEDLVSEASGKEVGRDIAAMTQKGEPVDSEDNCETELNQDWTNSPELFPSQEKGKLRVRLEPPPKGAAQWSQTEWLFSLRKAIHHGPGIVPPIPDNYKQRSEIRAKVVEWIAAVSEKKDGLPKPFSIGPNGINQTRGRALRVLGATLAALDTAPRWAGHPALVEIPYCRIATQLSASLKGVNADARAEIEEIAKALFEKHSRGLPEQSRLVLSQLPAFFRQWILQRLSHPLAGSLDSAEELAIYPDPSRLMQDMAWLSERFSPTDPAHSALFQFLSNHYLKDSVEKGKTPTAKELSEEASTARQLARHALGTQLREKTLGNKCSPEEIIGPAVLYGILSRGDVREPVKEIEGRNCLQSLQRHILGVASDSNAVPKRHDFPKTLTALTEVARRLESAEAGPCLIPSRLDPRFHALDKALHEKLAAADAWLFDGKSKGKWEGDIALVEESLRIAMWPDKSYESRLKKAEARKQLAPRIAKSGISKHFPVQNGDIAWDWVLEYPGVFDRVLKWHQESYPKGSESRFHWFLFRESLAASRQNEEAKLPEAEILKQKWGDWGKKTELFKQASRARQALCEFPELITLGRYLDGRGLNTGKEILAWAAIDPLHLSELVAYTNTMQLKLKDARPLEMFGKDTEKKDDDKKREDDEPLTRGGMPIDVRPYMGEKTARDGIAKVSKGAARTGKVDIAKFFLVRDRAIVADQLEKHWKLKDAHALMEGADRRTVDLMMTQIFSMAEESPSGDKEKDKNIKTGPARAAELLDFDPETRTFRPRSKFVTLARKSDDQQFFRVGKQSKFRGDPSFTDRRAQTAKDFDLWASIAETAHGEGILAPLAGLVERGVHKFVSTKCEAALHGNKSYLALEVGNLPQPNRWVFGGTPVEFQFLDTRTELKRYHELLKKLCERWNDASFEKDDSKAPWQTAVRFKNGVQLAMRLAFGRTTEIPSVLLETFSTKIAADQQTRILDGLGRLRDTTHPEIARWLLHELAVLARPGFSLTEFSRKLGPALKQFGDNFPVADSMASRRSGFTKADARTFLTLSSARSAELDELLKASPAHDAAFADAVELKDDAWTLSRPVSVPIPHGEASDWAVSFLERAAKQEGKSVSDLEGKLGKLTEPETADYSRLRVKQLARQWLPYEWGVGKHKPDSEHTVKARAKRIDELGFWHAVPTVEKELRKLYEEELANIIGIKASEQGELGGDTEVQGLSDDDARLLGKLEAKKDLTTDERKTLGELKAAREAYRLGLELAETSAAMRAYALYLTSGLHRLNLATDREKTLAKAKQLYQGLQKRHTDINQRIRELETDTSNAPSIATRLTQLRQLKAVHESFARSLEREIGREEPLRHADLSGRKVTIHYNNQYGEYSLRGVPIELLHGKGLTRTVVPELESRPYLNRFIYSVPNPECEVVEKRTRTESQIACHLLATRVFNADGTDFLRPRSDFKQTLDTPVSLWTSIVRDAPKGMGTAREELDTCLCFITKNLAADRQKGGTEAAQFYAEYKSKALVYKIIFNIADNVYGLDTALKAGEAKIVPDPARPASLAEALGEIQDNWAKKEKRRRPDEYDRKVAQALNWLDDYKAGKGSSPGRGESGYRELISWLESMPESHPLRFVALLHQAAPHHRRLLREADELRRTHDEKKEVTEAQKDMMVFARLYKRAPRSFIQEHWGKHSGGDAKALTLVDEKGGLNHDGIKEGIRSLREAVRAHERRYELPPLRDLDEETAPEKAYWAKQRPKQAPDEHYVQDAIDRILIPIVKEEPPKNPKDWKINPDFTAIEKQQHGLTPRLRALAGMQYMQAAQDVLMRNLAILRLGLEDGKEPIYCLDNRFRELISKRSPPPRFFKDLTQPEKTRAATLAFALRKLLHEGETWTAKRAVSGVLGETDIDPTFPRQESEEAIEGYAKWLGKRASESKAEACHVRWPEFGGRLDALSRFLHKSSEDVSTLELKKLMIEKEMAGGPLMLRLGGGMGKGRLKLLLDNEDADDDELALLPRKGKLKLFDPKAVKDGGVFDPKDAKDADVFDPKQLKLQTRKGQKLLSNKEEDDNPKLNLKSKRHDFIGPIYKTEEDELQEAYADFRKSTSKLSTKEKTGLLHSVEKWFGGKRNPLELEWPGSEKERDAKKKLDVLNEKWRNLKQRQLKDVEENLDKTRKEAHASLGLLSSNSLALVNLPPLYYDTLHYLAGTGVTAGSEQYKKIIDLIQNPWKGRIINHVMGDPDLRAGYLKNLSPLWKSHKDLAAFREMIPNLEALETLTAKERETLREKALTELVRLVGKEKGQLLALLKTIPKAGMLEPEAQKQLEDLMRGERLRVNGKRLEELDEADRVKQFYVLVVSALERWGDTEKGAEAAALERARSYLHQDTAVGMANWASRELHLLGSRREQGTYAKGLLTRLVNPDKGGGRGISTGTRHLLLDLSKEETKELEDVEAWMTDHLSNGDLGDHGWNEFRDAIRSLTDLKGLEPFKSKWAPNQQAAALVTSLDLATGHKQARKALAFGIDPPPKSDGAKYLQALADKHAFVQKRPSTPKDLDDVKTQIKHEIVRDTIADHLKKCAGKTTGEERRRKLAECKELFIQNVNPALQKEKGDESLKTLKQDEQVTVTALNRVLKGISAADHVPQPLDEAYRDLIRGEGDFLALSEEIWNACYNQPEPNPRPKSEKEIEETKKLKREEFHLKQKVLARSANLDAQVLRLTQVKMSIAQADAQVDYLNKAKDELNVKEQLKAIQRLKGTLVAEEKRVLAEIDAITGTLDLGDEEAVTAKDIQKLLQIRAALAAREQVTYDRQAGCYQFYVKAALESELTRYEDLKHYISGTRFYNGKTGDWLKKVADTKKANGRSWNGRSMGEILTSDPKAQALVDEGKALGFSEQGALQLLGLEGQSSNSDHEQLGRRLVNYFNWRRRVDIVGKSLASAFFQHTNDYFDKEPVRRLEEESKIGMHGFTVPKDRLAGMLTSSAHGESSKLQDLRRAAKAATALGLEWDKIIQAPPDFAKLSFRSEKWKKHFLWKGKTLEVQIKEQSDKAKCNEANRCLQGFSGEELKEKLRLVSEPLYGREGTDVLWKELEKQVLAAWDATKHADFVRWNKYVVRVEWDEKEAGYRMHFYWREDVEKLFVHAEKQLESTGKILQEKRVALRAEYNHSVPYDAGRWAFEWAGLAEDAKKAKMQELNKAHAEANGWVNLMESMAPAVKELDKSRKDHAPVQTRVASFRLQQDLDFNGQAVENWESISDDVWWKAQMTGALVLSYVVPIPGAPFIGNFMKGAVTALRLSYGTAMLSNDAFYLFDSNKSWGLYQGGQYWSDIGPATLKQMLEFGIGQSIMAPIMAVGATASSVQRLASAAELSPGVVAAAARTVRTLSARATAGTLSTAEELAYQQAMAQLQKLGLTAAEAVAQAGTIEKYVHATMFNRMAQLAHRYPTSASALGMGLGSGGVDLTHSYLSALYHGNPMDHGKFFTKSLMHGLHNAMFAAGVDQKIATWVERGFYKFIPPLRDRWIGHATSLWLGVGAGGFTNSGIRLLGSHVMDNPVHELEGQKAEKEREKLKLTKELKDAEKELEEMRKNAETFGELDEQEKKITNLENHIRELGNRIKGLEDQAKEIAKKETFVKMFITDGIVDMYFGLHGAHHARQARGLTSYRRAIDAGKTHEQAVEAFWRDTNAGVGAYIFGRGRAPNAEQRPIAETVLWQHLAGHPGGAQLLRDLMETAESKPGTDAGRSSAEALQRLKMLLARSLSRGMADLAAEQMGLPFAVHEVTDAELKTALDSIPKRDRESLPLAELMPRLRASLATQRRARLAQIEAQIAGGQFRAGALVRARARRDALIRDVLLVAPHQWRDIVKVENMTPATEIHKEIMGLITVVEGITHPRLREYFEHIWPSRRRNVTTWDGFFQEARLLHRGTPAERAEFLLKNRVEPDKYHAYLLPENTPEGRYQAMREYRTVLTEVLANHRDSRTWPADRRTVALNFIMQRQFNVQGERVGRFDSALRAFAQRPWP